MLRLLRPGVSTCDHIPSCAVAHAKFITSCGLFWKAFGIVVAGFFIFGAFKLLLWAVTVILPAFSLHWRSQ
jgi:hypothetical protein